MNEVRSGEPLVIGEVIIVPLERVERYGVNNEKGFFVYLSKRPVRVTVDSSEGSWNFELEDWKSKAESGRD